MPATGEKEPPNQIVHLTWENSRLCPGRLYVTSFPSAAQVTIVLGKHTEKSGVKRWKPVDLKALSGDTQKVYDVLNNESDLACVLIGTSYLSELLANIIETSFIETSISEKLLDPQSGAIGQFATRADLAYCLGRISKSAYRDLARVAMIRNRFAHKHIALDFSDSDIRKLCGELEAWQILQGDEDDPTELSQEQLRNQARNQFNMSVVLMGSLFHADALGKMEQRKKT